MKKLLLSTFIGLNALFACAEKPENAFKKSENTFLSKTTTSKDTLRMIIFADTQDDEIGKGAKVSLEYYRDLAKEISENTGLVLSPKYYYDESFSAENFDDITERLIANSNDVIYFVYLAHGFREPDQQEQEPRMHFDEKNSRSVFKLKDKLINKNARLIIVHIESCNTETDQSTSINPDRINSANIENVPIEDNNYTKLFLSSRGHIVNVTAKPKQASFYDAEKGGVATQKFKCAFRCTLSEKNKTEKELWENILNISSCATANTIRNSQERIAARFKINGIAKQEPFFSGLINDQSLVQNNDCPSTVVEPSGEVGELRAAFEKRDYRKAKALIMNKKISFLGGNLSRLDFEIFWRSKVGKNYLPIAITDKTVIVSSNAEVPPTTPKASSSCDCN